MREREPEQHIHAVLTGIANRARIDKEHRFGGLYTLLNKDLIVAASGGALLGKSSPICWSGTTYLPRT